MQVLRDKIEGLQYGYVYLMHRKFNALDKFKEFKVESKQ